MLFGTMKNLLVDIADKDMFRRGVYIFDHAIPVLAQGPPKDPAAKLDPLNQPRKTKKEPTICNLDVCKAMLLLCTLVCSSSSPSGTFSPRSVADRASLQTKGRKTSSSLLSTIRLGPSRCVFGYRSSVDPSLKPLIARRST